MGDATVKATFIGDSSSLEKTFQSVGSKAVSMAGDFDKAEGKAKSFGGAMDSAGGAADASESKFMGAADLLDGLGGAFGLPTEGATNMMRSFGDLSGGFAALQPMIGGVGTMFKTLSGTLMTPPMGIILLIGALAAALVVAYQKSETFRDIVRGAFGIVKGVVESLVGTFQSVGAAIGGAFTAGIGMAKGAINGLIGAIETGLNIVMTPYRMASGFLNKIPGIGSAVPDFLTRDLHLPRLHTGGIVPGSPGTEVPILAMAGETVTRAGAGGGGGGTTVIQLVLDGRIITEVVHAGLLAKQRRTPLGLAT